MDSSASSLSVLYFQALYPFQGDASARQLTFAAGAVLRVQAAHAAAATQGWTWGSLVKSNSEITASGWFPTGYAVLTAAPTASSSSSKPTLPWIKEEQQQQQQQRDDQAQDDNGDFGGTMLGGHSPALDYSTANTELHRHNDNPFATVSHQHDALSKMRGDEHITITMDSKKPRKFGQRLQKGWQKAASSSKLLTRQRRVAADNSMVPSIAITPATQ